MNVQRLGRAFFADPATAAGTIIVAGFLTLALFGPLVAPYSPTAQNVDLIRQPPSPSHLFGTDRLGRDLFSRIVYGARDMLALAGGGTALAVIFGTLIGVSVAYLGGWLEELVFRLFDGLLAMPALLLALLLLGAVGPSRVSVLLVIVVVYTPIVARVARSVVLTLKPRGFIEAARMRDERLSYVLWRELLPLVAPTLAVEAALRFSYAIFLVASLGFLGVGVQPPNPDWGLMVLEARNEFALAPWSLYVPAAAIALLVIGVNLMAEGVRRAIGES
ncbi:ABC transporter permease [Chloroflexus sp.]|uniref:ABC transporter permease n=1 Tax=Chloroflexus sp. TaxID=1904827 RepID=UPI00298F23EA|nr:ABC transporter permease [Chloroflexus sp.]MCS6888967.1 ABC transporter permease [Chloroflexus sp.]MDW8405746.1 ABC transporter permease [Chloroflexus sp.]